ncbi:MAG TPA: MYXO-CTERM sorting domain-containing protein [Polyangiaceae bacterium]|nr:MYXO-CTERM sorting domain-containing protein [Polyangiaceae bacterium]
MTDRIKLWVLLTLVAGVFLVSPARAQVFQTDAAKTQLPQPVGMNELNLITDSWGWNVNTTSWKDPYTGAQLVTPPPTFTDPNSGAMLTIPIRFGDFYSPANGYPQFANGDAITLQGLFKWRKEMLDPVKDARTTPGYFSPACGFTGQLLLMGGNCNVSFGWYNVTDPNSTTPPPANEIYEFIPNDPKYLNCLDENGGPKTDGFCPKAWDTRSPRNLSIRTWTPKAFDSGNIKSDMRYKGGAVGFAVIGNPAKACKQNKYSMAAYNQKNAGGEPWVTALIYQSTVDPEGFYMAFEDLPMSPADWHKTGVQGDMSENDGDFNDFVFYVSGISCMGGGDACDTGLKGACSVGRTDCVADATQTPTCRPVVPPGKELCDNVDNDCNGMVDDGDLCPAGKVCDKGQCISACSTGEFKCPNGTECNEQGYCVDIACLTLMCPMGQACREGKCVEPCTGVTCPLGQSCQLGRCVDPCGGVTCPSGRVCEKGLCVSECPCRACAAGLQCSAGHCVDPSCSAVTCPGGQVCMLGKCIDPCAGVVCPGGGVCTNGQCSDPTGQGGSSGPGTGTGGVVVIGSGGQSQGTGSTNTGTGSTGTAGAGGGRRPTSESGCNCRVGGSSGSAFAWAGVALALALGLRRRRSQPSKN